MLTVIVDSPQEAVVTELELAGEGAGAALPRAARERREHTVRSSCQGLRSEPLTTQVCAWEAGR